MTAITQCTVCERRSSSQAGSLCKMPQPSGAACPGVLLELREQPATGRAELDRIRNLLAHGPRGHAWTREDVEFLVGLVEDGTCAEPCGAYECHENGCERAGR